MRPFSYHRPADPIEAARLAAAHPGARFIAGGTNLLDLMKIDVEQPTHLVDISRLPLREVAETPTAGCASAPWSATPTSPPTSACASAIRCWRWHC